MSQPKQVCRPCGTPVFFLWSSERGRAVRVEGKRLVVVTEADGAITRAYLKHHCKPKSSAAPPVDPAQGESPSVPTGTSPRRGKKKISSISRKETLGSNHPAPEPAAAPDSTSTEEGAAE
ncbi:MAG: hypothetical protein M3547_01050 [Acidobacteriota bacterium]|nr:hypothetical protein [Acidobacteriota bacterium]